MGKVFPWRPLKRAVPAPLAICRISCYMSPWGDAHVSLSKPETPKCSPSARRGVDRNVIDAVAEPAHVAGSTVRQKATRGGASRIAAKPLKRVAASFPPVKFQVDLEFPNQDTHP